MRISLGKIKINLRSNLTCNTYTPVHMHERNSFLFMTFSARKNYSPSIHCIHEIYTTYYISKKELEKTEKELKSLTMAISFQDPTASFFHKSVFLKL